MPISIEVEKGVLDIEPTNPEDSKPDFNMSKRPSNMVSSWDHVNKTDLSTHEKGNLVKDLNDLEAGGGVGEW